MDLTELIQISRVQGVIVHRPFEIPDKYDLVITGHHMILSENDGNNEVTVSSTFQVRKCTLFSCTFS